MGGAAASRAARRQDGWAANPFESALRGICHGVDGLHVRPQVPIHGPSFAARPDLVDPDLGVVVEADSFGWHGDRAALRRDCRRYDELVSLGWVVLRFAWEDVVHDPAWVARVLQDVVHRRTERPRACPTPA